VGGPATGAAGDAELQAFRRAGHALVDGVADYLAGLPSRPVWQPVPDALREQLLVLPLPERGGTLDDMVATALRDVLPHAMGNGHPGFFGWVNPPPSVAGVLASLAAAAMNPSVVSGDHADVFLERTVVRWLAELVGFPHQTGAGLLTSGASAATIVCLAGARGRALAAVGHDVRHAGLAGAPRLVAYVPSEAHSCVRRALELLGLGSGAMRDVPLDGGRLDAVTLRASIAADRASGAVPALLVGSAGTVNAGVIDPLAELADVATAEGLWFHVDGAYGAFGVLDPAISARFRGMERADSLTLDPHKWLGVPVDAGCALVRRGDDLRDAFSLIPPYLRARTRASRSGRSPSTGSSRRGRSARSRPGRRSPLVDAPASPPRWRGRTSSPASWRRWSNASPSWSWPPRPRRPSSPFAPGRPAVRPTAWTTSTARCPRRFRREAARS
jgi:glutamate/tyrosine decarboxylase-like PLP-dependent enzyme